MESSKKFYLKMVFFLLLTLCLTYLSLWYQLPEIAYLLFVLSAILNLIIVTKLYKSNTKLKNELRKKFLYRSEYQITKSPEIT
ncbi:hypothetical protein Sdiek1_2327 [Sulfurospirillum diekertiae]|uniref:Uncharacterized protein n=1 Tax=Sulfurospirillum diekertiae TaxID=1854492 RepID=A0A1Y0HMZ9_9BACT|nr:hypothetical protein Sdiek1_2327 [Sulfurospirillum diekertiae]